MKQLEPPLSKTADLPFLIGRDSRGHWVVQTQDHSCGGLFVDRKQALRFAMLERGQRPDAVIMVPGIFELDISGPRPKGRA